VLEKNGKNNEKPTGIKNNRKSPTRLKRRKILFKELNIHTGTEI